jgi:hypothetical protein
MLPIKSDSFFNQFPGLFINQFDLANTLIRIFINFAALFVRALFFRETIECALCIF